MATFYFHVTTHTGTVYPQAEIRIFRVHRQGEPVCGLDMVCRVLFQADTDRRVRDGNFVWHQTRVELENARTARAVALRGQRVNQLFARLAGRVDSNDFPLERFYDVGTGHRNELGSTLQGLIDIGVRELDGDWGKWSEGRSSLTNELIGRTA